MLISFNEIIHIKADISVRAETPGLLAAAVSIARSVRKTFNRLRPRPLTALARPPPPRFPPCRVYPIWSLMVPFLS
jgi:hypothetical protein